MLTAGQGVRARPRRQRSGEKAQQLGTRPPMAPELGGEQSAAAGVEVEHLCFGRVGGARSNGVSIGTPAGGRPLGTAPERRHS